MKEDTAQFLRKEARRLYKGLSLRDKLKLGSYRPLYLELKKSWKDTKNHITKENIEEWQKQGLSPE